MIHTIQELEALCAAATLGPWTWKDAGNNIWFLAVEDGNGNGLIVLELTERAEHPSEADQDLIAAARTAIPELIARIKDLDPSYNAAPAQDTSARIAEREGEAAAKRAKLDKALADAKLGDAAGLDALGLEAYLDDLGDVKIRPKKRGSYMKRPVLCDKKKVLPGLLWLQCLKPQNHEGECDFSTAAAPLV